MASSPLFGQAVNPNLTLASLLAGQNQTQDPAVAAMAPRMQLSQAMLQQGLDSSPTSGRLGGLSRLASALAGLYGMQQSTEGLNDIATQRRNDALNLSNMWNAPAASPVAPVAQAPASDAGAAPQVPVQSSPLATGQGPGDVPPDLLPHFQEAAATHNIPMSVLLAQAKQESGFDPAVVSKTGGVGLMQVQPSTASSPGFGLDPIDPASLKDARSNIMFGAKYLAARGKDAGVTDWNDPQQVAAGLKAYNGGGDPDYVQHVMRYMPQADKGVQVAGPGATTSGVTPSVTPAPVGAAPQGGAPQGGGVPPAVTPAQQPLQTGMNAPNIAKGLAMIKEAHQAQLMNPYNQQIQTLSQQRIEDAKTLMGLDTVVQNRDGTQTHLNTGEQSNAAVPRANYQQSSPGVYEDASHVGKPVFAPAGRITVNPITGEVITTGHAGPQVFQSPNTDAAAALSAAKAQGSKTGEAAVATLGKMVNLGHEADSAVGNIDYGINQLHQAAAGGVNSGYFAPWLATASAAGKSLGIDLHNMGIDPTAVGNVQSAQKTLAVVAGQILQNTIGKDSAITDAKIEHFIHAQPDIATDPQAIERVLGWARSQFVYNREMAMHAMEHTDANGNLPPGWQASFYREKKAFAPIYDPLSQEMKQPQGQGPAPDMPKAPTTQAAPAAAAKPSYEAVHAEMVRRGLLKQ